LRNIHVSQSPRTPAPADPQTGGWCATEINGDGNGNGNGNGNADYFHSSSNVVAFRAVVWEPTLPRPREISATA